MVVVSLRNTLYHFRTLQLQQHQPLSYYRVTGERQRRRVDKALRILDIVSTRKDTTALGGRGSHLRLIEDFLRTDFSQSHKKSRIRDCSLSYSSAEIRTDRTPQPSPEKEEEFGVSGAVVLSNAVSSCVSNRDLRGGIQYHCLAIATGFVSNAYVGSSLITMYSKCVELCNAHRVFDEMPARNVVSWTAIISGFSQEWHINMCLQLYSEMRKSAVGPNDFTFTSLLSACSGSGALGQGRSAHCQAVHMGFDSYLHVANALISMYCKCGSLKAASFVFEEMGNNRDIVSWNSMIAGYAQHGLAVEAINLFEEMKNQGKLKPDTFTFLGVLSSCRHVGFVEKGRMYFNSMTEYGVTAELDHYACLVDLLGRAGLLEEARDVIEGMPVRPNAVIWGSLLWSCRHHGSVWCGVEAAEQKLSMDPECAATHLQLANLYAGMKRWGEAA